MIRWFELRSEHAALSGRCRAPPYHRRAALAGRDYITTQEVTMWAGESSRVKPSDFFYLHFWVFSIWRAAHCACRGADASFMALGTRQFHSTRRRADAADNVNYAKAFSGGLAVCVQRSRRSGAPSGSGSPALVTLALTLSLLSFFILARRCCGWTLLLLNRCCSVLSPVCATFFSSQAA